MKTLHLMVAVCCLLLASFPVWANVFSMGGGQKNLEFVTVGDPGNQADTRYVATGVGAVGYNYQIGKYDVTAGQYCQFLNAVAANDPYGLYSTDMAGSVVGCGIVRGGTAGGYTYTVTRNPDFPTNYVSWDDTARFCNWLSNGQPAGLLTGNPAQDAWLTEDGSYTLNGITNNGVALAAITRNPAARYVIPSDNEWYKAAYYKGGSTHAGYWLYPTKSNAEPSNVLSNTGTNNANFYDPAKGYFVPNDGFTDPVNRLTAVGSFAACPGPYGTFDQGGNVFQWLESSYSGAYRGARGGTFYQDYPLGLNYVTDLRADIRYTVYPTDWRSSIGFRVALVPEPATLSLLALGGLLLARRRRA